MSFREKFLVPKKKEEKKSKKEAHLSEIPLGIGLTHSTATFRACTKVRYSRNGWTLNAIAAFQSLDDLQASRPAPSLIGRRVP